MRTAHRKNTVHCWMSLWKGPSPMSGPCLARNGKFNLHTHCCRHCVLFVSCSFKCFANMGRHSSPVTMDHPFLIHLHHQHRPHQCPSPKSLTPHASNLFEGITSDHEHKQVLWMNVLEQHSLSGWLSHCQQVAIHARPKQDQQILNVDHSFASSRELQSMA